MLSELQPRVAGIVAGLAEADDFVLAGGAALILHGMVGRSTRDLDYFATAGDAIAALLPALEPALRRDGFRVARRRDAPGFVRLEARCPKAGQDGAGRSEQQQPHDSDDAVAPDVC